MRLPDERAGIAQRLSVYLDPGSDEPLFRQIVDRMWLEVVTGTLETGERLPTVRQLAIDLSVHPNAVQRAYKELEMLGVLVTRPGGTYVALTSPDTSALERRAQLDRLCTDMLTQGRALGFTIHDIIDALTELRAARREGGTREGE